MQNLIFFFTNTNLILVVNYCDLSRDAQNLHKIKNFKDQIYCNQNIRNYFVGTKNMHALSRSNFDTHKNMLQDKDNKHTNIYSIILLTQNSTITISNHRFSLTTAHNF